MLKSTFSWLFFVGTLVLSLTILCPFVYAEVSLKDSRAWKRARLVSAGQQVWSFQSSYQKISDRFGATGRVEPLGARYGRAVTWGQLLNAENSVEGRREVEGYMRSRGANREDIAATSAYELEREEVGFAVDWAYGLTRRWMIGFQLPLVMRRTEVTTRVQMAPALAQGVGTASSGKSVLALDNAQVQNKVKALAEDELFRSGYDEIPDQSQEWTWGDVNLLNQFYLYNDLTTQWSLQQMVRFPTARNPSVTDYFQQTSDEGQVDLGLTSLLDYRFKRWILGARLGYVAQLPDSAKLRVAEDNLAIDPKVSRDLGDWTWGAVDADYRLSRRLNLEVEYAFLAKSRDKYKGQSVTGREYSALGRDSDQEIHQARLGMVYDLGQSTARRGVERKWLVSGGYTYPLTGRNTVEAGRAAVELTAYF